MTIESIAQFTMLASLWLMVLELGTRATAGSLVHVLRSPALLVRAFVAMFVIVPAFAVLLAALTDLPAPIRFALVAMSVAPIPPMLPRKQMMAGGGLDYTVGLLIAASVGAIVATPLLIGLSAMVLGAEAAVKPSSVAITLLVSIILPIMVGRLATMLWPQAGARIERHAHRAGAILLYLSFAVLMIVGRREIWTLVGDGSVLAIAATVVVGLIAGHLLSGGREGGALALAAACRHPGVAMVVAHLSYPERQREIAGAILLYLVVTTAVTLPYEHWVRRRMFRPQVGSVA